MTNPYKYIRRQLRLTQQEASKVLLGLDHHQSWARYEQGENISYSNMKKLYDYGLDVNILFSDSIGKTDSIFRSVK